MAAEPVTDVVLSRVVVGTAHYARLPLDVPAGVTRIDLALETARPAVVGLGLFDGGHDSRPAGFRGITGRERREVFVGLDAATPGFVPGAIDPGRWTVLVPVYLAAVPTRVTVRARMTHGIAVPPLQPEPLPGVVRDTPAWYRGDLHCHTVHSSDAWATGHAMTPARWAEQARRAGLDFVALTDHNTVSQNRSLATAAGSSGVLLLAGEEMTNAFHGHATVVGIDPGGWLDFRQSPYGLPLPTGGQRITDFLSAARGLGAYVCAAHPLSWGNPWQFLLEGLQNPAARPDGLEVWNGRWRLGSELALRAWDRMLRNGWDVAASGGSDLHSIADETHGVGEPTTVVHADSLSTAAVVDGLRAGRSFVTRRPAGVEIYLTAYGIGGQETFTGGRVYGDEGTTASVRALVRGGAGMRLRLLTERGEVSRTRLADDEQVVEVEVPIGARHGFVRAEVRRAARDSRARPSLDMEAFSNPIRLVAGRMPAGTGPRTAPPPPI